ncbi:sulfate ABC transporter ATP-binding protein [Rhizobium rhizosphaerae]|uniref:Sulfate ABC transporter ATP-binding protein n=1 Tax=Xaviernesmea rhizosphaerae TaxID=1672749 RepID=A0ABX3PF46_9HYPH|nr:sulfate/molybdate ABC transporter ATP-binding protein [Xaviernesmea rhizosphaerae]OQP87159.1 sulfate ABC transporter ATP-binding protein [Xaviernesmea rhizosphaerae]
MKINLDHVVKTFNTFRAVHDVSLSVESGELVALLGPSGSGKTTLLRMVAGLEFPDAGQIRFGEQDATQIPVRERGVGFVFQHYALFPHLSVADNIAFGMRTARAARRSKAEIDARVEELLRLVQLSGLGNRFPAQISGGQRQRVALARALAVDPKVLLLDEPFGALDANVRRDLRRWLREIHAELGITTLFVTHDQEEALDLADRVVILQQGRIVQQGTPRAVTRQPNSAFVMRFLGDTHQLSATAKGGQVMLGDLSLDATGLADGPVDVFVRPADLEWAGQGSGDQPGPGLPATVTRVIDRPGARRLAVSFEGHGLELDVAPEVEVAAGDRGRLRILRSRIFPA